MNEHKLKAYSGHHILSYHSAQNTPRAYVGKPTCFSFTVRYKTLRTAGNKLVVNLAIANFIMHSKSWVLIVNGIAGGPILGELGMNP